jgi:hypothetical protein
MMRQAVFSTKFRALFCCVTLMLASCATVPPPSMSVDEIASFNLVGVEVHGVEVIRSWPVEEKHFLATNTDPEIARRLPDESAQNFPAVQAFFQAALQRVFTAQLESMLAPVMRGTRPVKIIVTLKQFDVPSVVRRVLIDQYAKIQATIDLVDIKTNALILSYPGPYRLQFLLGGLSAPIADAIAGDSDPENTLIANYILDYRTWLVTR